MMLFEKSHNPYFNRWFSAIVLQKMSQKSSKSHNPYFNRWFSAITDFPDNDYTDIEVTILILIDGFLQYNECGDNCLQAKNVTILILIDGFLQYGY